MTSELKSEFEAIEVPLIVDRETNILIDPEIIDYNEFIRLLHLSAPYIVSDLREILFMKTESSNLMKSIKGLIFREYSLSKNASVSESILSLLTRSITLDKLRERFFLEDLLIHEIQYRKEIIQIRFDPTNLILIGYWKSQKIDSIEANIVNCYDILINNIKKYIDEVFSFDYREWLGIYHKYSNEIYNTEDVILQIDLIKKYSQELIDLINPKWSRDERKQAYNLASFENKLNISKSKLERKKEKMLRDLFPFEDFEFVFFESQNHLFSVFKESQNTYYIESMTKLRSNYLVLHEEFSSLSDLYQFLRRKFGKFWKKNLD